MKSRKYDFKFFFNRQLQQLFSIRNRLSPMAHPGKSLASRLAEGGRTKKPRTFSLAGATGFW